MTGFKRLKAVSAAGRALLPTLDQEVANEREKDFRVRQDDARLKAKLRGNLSGKVSTDLRRDPIADRDIFEEIQYSLKVGASIRLVARMGAGVIRREGPVHQSTWKKIKAQIRKEKSKHATSDQWVRTMWVPHWDHTGNHLKGMACAAALFERRGRALTLRLGPEVIDAGRSSPVGFAAYMRRKIAKALRAAAEGLGIETPEFFFVVEDTDLTEVHLHGAMLMPEDERAIRIVRAALVRAGGRWGGQSSGRQLDTPELETPVRWFAYINKWQLGSALHTQGRTFAATNGVRSMARAWYQDARSSGLKMRADTFWSDHGSIPLDKGSRT